jgi:hypothetical protein
MKTLKYSRHGQGCETIHEHSRGHERVAVSLHKYENRCGDKDLKIDTIFDFKNWQSRVTSIPSKENMNMNNTVHELLSRTKKTVIVDVIVVNSIMQAEGVGKG